jgi:excisionase family DNA binding protein
MPVSQFEILQPTASDARAARQSMRALEDVFQKAVAQREHGRVELEGVEIPASVARALMTIIQEMAAGHTVAVHPLDTPEVSTVQAAQILGVSRPTVIDLLKREGVPYRMAGTHRRIPVAEVFALKARLERNGSTPPKISREERLRALREMAGSSDELELGY